MENGYLTNLNSNKNNNGKKEKHKEIDKRDNSFSNSNNIQVNSNLSRYSKTPSSPNLKDVNYNLNDNKSITNNNKDVKNQTKFSENNYRLNEKYDYSCDFNKNNRNTINSGNIHKKEHETKFIYKLSESEIRDILKSYNFPNEMNLNLNGRELMEIDENTLKNEYNLNYKDRKTLLEFICKELNKSKLILYSNFIN